MLDSENSLSPDEIESKWSTREVIKDRQARHPPPRVPARVLTAELPVRTSVNKTVLAHVPLAWPSIDEHDPEVNLDVTRFLFTLQHLYDIYMAWGDHQATTQDVRETFNELVERWHAVEDSYSDCCNASVKGAEEGLGKIRRLCGATFGHEGPNWTDMKDNQSQFSSSIRDDVIERLKELHHLNKRRA